MKNFSDNLATQLQLNLETINYTETQTIEQTKISIKIVIESLEELKQFVKNKSFVSKQEEILFFKEVKPEFFSKLIYYNEIYRMEMTKPAGSFKNAVRYYKAEQRKLEDFYAQNKDFYRYFRTGSKHLDKMYFTRKKYNLKLLPDSSFFQTDTEFTTSHDFLLSRIMANEQIQNYLKLKITENLESKEGASDNSIVGGNQLNWTGSKVALVELIYAIEASGVINNGNTTLNAIASGFQNLFNLKIPQFNRVFLEIKNRKSIEQTSFLNQLKSNLIKRMEESEK